MKLHDHIQNSRNVYVVALFVAGISVALARPESKADVFPLSIIHINDFHARFEPTDTSGGACDVSKECVGSYARTVHTVRRLLEEQKNNNAVYFNAGDNFQGSLWYNVGRWNVTSQFLNMLPADAMTLGNHEFDHGIEGIVPFLETINSPMLVANIDATNEPDLVGKYQKSMIIERNQRKIGVIGVILETTYELSYTGKLIFLNESDTILEEASKLKAQGANIIIVLSHCGYDVDKVIAEKAGSEIDVIIGSHSHTFLYTGDTPPGPDTPRGEYPTVVDHSSGHRVLIVQAAAYAKYVGNITVYFDSEGNVVDFEGAPIYMANKVPEDNKVLDAMRPWKEYIDIRGTKMYGKTLVDLSKRYCDSQECNLGNFVCDAMVYAFKNLKIKRKPSKTVSIGLVNNRAIKSTIYKGNITYSKIIAMCPYENILTAFDLPAEQLLKALELSVSTIDLTKNINKSYIFLQVSGLKITYNFTKPAYERVVDLKVRCAACSPSRYEPFNSSASYRIVTPNFLQNGGNGFSMFRDYATNIVPYKTNVNAIEEYLHDFSPISAAIEDRITIV